MFLVSVIYILITVGTTYAGDETEVTVKHLDPEEGTAGYDLFYYDGESLRDEKWRFDPKSGSTVVSRRNGFRDKDNFHLVDATLDALGSFTKSYKMKNEPSFLKERVREPQMHKNGDNIGNEDVNMSNAFSGVSFNTQYSTQNGFPHVSNVVGIQQINAPNQYNGLNFQQAFSTSGFGVQQHGSLFNHQTQFPPSNPTVTFPNNQNFQLSSFITQFLNQHNNHNQHLPFGSFPSSFGTFGSGMGHEHATEKPVATSTIQNTPQSTTEPIVNEQTTATTARTTTTTTTTSDPTLNFDVRLEKDEQESANETDTGNVQTTSRRTIEGLPSSDEDYSEDGGVLDDKIGPKVLLSAVG
ncbi:uncharacterized protein LOC119085423 [Bradysia coprophila]|uniref:uncharacterized protein LOC119085423 n=1 Tax=Bradysia coprophila TaxID=38358 RepID=UPI00187D8695|nr:uncharacterized protein LOC119085423 [Bradysia coprophila]